LFAPTSMSLFDPDRSAERIPVSLVTGFLGSGKTTLLNHMLSDPGMKDSAVIVNEFGAIGLDHLLLERIDGETVLMASGCLCCTVRSDLERSLSDLYWKRRESRVPNFARVLVETTGLADPAPILQLLLNNPIVANAYRLDAVVTTVDAVNAPRQLDEHAESVKQVALADRIVVTKGDLKADTAALESRLLALNPAAPVHRVQHGAIAPDRLFGAALYDPTARSADARRWLNAEAYGGASSQDRGDVPHGYHADEHHNHGAGGVDVNRHDARIAAFCLVEDRPIDWERFHRWLGALRAQKGESLLRVKGILNLAGEGTPVVIHGVHHVFHPPVQLKQWPDDDRRSRVVFITRELPGEIIRRSWEEVR
jgi:G3E family GTPase